MKLYKSQDVAQKIADKKSASGTAFAVIATEGGFFVLTAEQQASLSKPAPATIDATSQLKKQRAAEVVEVTVKGAKITKEYVITPEMGKRPRWFERKRIVSAEKTEGGVKMHVTRGALYSRGLKELADSAQLVA